MDCSPTEPQVPESHVIDERIRELMWAQLPARGIMAQEMRCLRAFLEMNSLWDEYLKWVRRVGENR
jgi:hypothetical protein